MKFVVNVFLALTVAIGAAFAIGPIEDNSSAKAYSANDAIMTIRFNQKNVAYQDKLFYVVREAVKTKPTVVFDVVSVSANGQSQYGQQVANDIERIGVSKAQITFRNESGAVNNEEVRIFVR